MNKEKVKKYDIFISYSREDRGIATTIAKLLTEKGMSVWFDIYTPVASQWENILKYELENARCILMLWSKQTKKSTWVPKEGAVGLDRTVLVPVLIEECNIPKEFFSIQFSNLTKWDCDPENSIFVELLQAIHYQMLPKCQIVFDSIFEVNQKSIKVLFDTYLRTADRLGHVTVASHFSPPKSLFEKQRLYRIISSMQISIIWDKTLINWYDTSERFESFIHRTELLEKYIPLLWLHLQKYSGPFLYSSNSIAHKNFLCFASIMFFFEMYHKVKWMNHNLHIPSTIDEINLEFPRWEGCISAVFKEKEDVAAVYVRSIDNLKLQQEVVIYAPKSLSQRAYGCSLRYAYKEGYTFTEPVLFEQYIVPQFELRRALEGLTEQIEYQNGNVVIRKITDLQGNDLEPIYIR